MQWISVILKFDWHSYLFIYIFVKSLLNLFACKVKSFLRSNIQHVKYLFNTLFVFHAELLTLHYPPASCDRLKYVVVFVWHAIKTD
jgi:hypothetical protein